MSEKWKQWEEYTDPGGWGWIAGPLTPEARAVVAAAPDLLEALREVVRVVFDGDWTAEAQPALEQAKVAIAKAEGDGVSL